MMAQPWKHPDTGMYYLRRQIPEAIRPAFGGKSLWKASLKTKDFAKAAILFAQANAELEGQFEQARERLAETGDPRPSQRDRAEQLVQGYFRGSGHPEGGLDGPERLLLARLEVDLALWNSDPGLRRLAPGQPSSTESWWKLANNAALFRAHPSVRQKVDPAHPPGSVWGWPDRSFFEGAKAKQVGRVVEQIGLHYGLTGEDLPTELNEAIAAFFDREPVQLARERKPRAATSRLNPGMRLMELFELWEEKQKPKEQSAHEYKRSVQDFVEFIGDIGIGEITNDDLLEYRDAVEKLPASMPRADRDLPFSERVTLHAGSSSRLSPASVKKKVGAIQAMLSFARDEKYVARNEGRDVKIAGYSKVGRKRSTFQRDELKALLANPLFMQPGTWRTNRAVTHVTLYWVFLLALTTGARLEEVGQAAIRDIKKSDGIRYLDVTDYVPNDVDETKSVKTDSSRRLVPIHDRIIALGFEKYLAALTEAGHTQVFPDLKVGAFGKRTKEASRHANRLIDKSVSKDSRLVFHSARHGFKDLATEAGISERIIDQMCGHAPTSVGGNYGVGVSLNSLHRELHRIDWSFLDWDALAAATGGLDWSIVIQGRNSA